jgi:hypothetical protein
LFFLELVILVLAFAASRFYFGGYVRSAHPDIWERLVVRGDRSGVVNLTLFFDATPEVGRFRTSSADDLGDPELASRRRIANRLEQLVVYGFIALVLWGITSVALLIVLKAE